MNQGEGHNGDKKKIRRRYKIDRFPGHVQAAIFRGYIRGDAYWKIRQDVQQLGFQISENGLSRYWRNVWGAEVNRLRKARAYKEALCEALQLEPQSESAKVAGEMLYGTVFKMLDQIEQENPLALLREAREQQKVGGTANGAGSKAKTTERKSLKRHLEQLYGPGVVVEEEIEGSDPEDETG